jgi:hypothetical protein
MNAGELIFGIGFKGAEEAKQKISGIEKSLDDVRSSSLAVKAALVGILYGLKEMTGAAGLEGAQLMNLSTGLGVAVDHLQSLQNAFRDVNVSGEEVGATLSNLQKIAINSRTQGFPTWFGQFAAATGLNTREFQTATGPVLEKALQKAQDFAKANAANPALVSQYLSSFASPNVISGMIRNPHADLSKRYGPIVDAAQLDRVNRANVAVENTLRGIRDSFVAANGVDLAKELNLAANGLSNLSKALGQMMGRIPVLKDLKIELVAIGAAALAFGPLGAAITALLALMAKLEEHKNDKTDASGKPSFWQILSKPGGGSDPHLLDDYIKDKFKGLFSGTGEHSPLDIKPKIGPGSERTSMNNTFIINTPSTDPKEHGRIAAKEFQNAAFQSGAITALS